MKLWVPDNLVLFLYQYIDSGHSKLNRNWFKKQLFVEVPQNNSLILLNSQESRCRCTEVSLQINLQTGYSFHKFYKKRLWHGYFLVNFVKFLRIHFVQNTPATASVIYLQLLPKSPIFSLRTTHSILCFSFFDLAFVAIITCSNKLVVM